MSRIQCKDITIKYESTTVIDRMNLTIEDGCFFTLLGPSGCGKTTLLLTIAGFVQPASGSILFDDQDVTRLPAHLRNIGFVFQDHALFPNMNVFDNVAYGLRARKVDQKEIGYRVAEALEMVNLESFKERFPNELSGGQRQRVALARALVIKPSVLLMDEPLSSLDSKLRIQMRQTIGDIQKDIGITTIFVTHDQEEALDLADQVAVVNRGDFEQIGTPQEVYSAPKTAFVGDFIGSANILPISGVMKTDSQRAICSLQNGFQLEATLDPDLDLQKQSSTLIIRPEDIAISQQQEQGMNSLLGRVIGSQYLGYKISYRIEIFKDQVITVDVMKPAVSDAIAIGTKVFVALPCSSRIVRR